MTRKKALTSTYTFSRSEAVKTAIRNSFRSAKNFHHVYPPPIFVLSQEKFLSLRESLSHTKVTYKARRDALVIYPETEESHTEVVDLLKKMQLVYQTFPLKTHTAFRVKINNLSHSIPEETVKKELEDMGYKVRRVGVAKETDTGKLLPAFFVELEPGEGSSSVLQVRRLIDTRVTIEECEDIQLPQCSNCQDYGHEQKVCTAEARCSKCAGPHLSWQCRRNRTAPLICALCGGPHPATYKGCIVYKSRVREAKGLPTSMDPLSRAPLMNFLLSTSDPAKSIKHSKESLPAVLAEGVHKKNKERDADSDLWSDSSSIRPMTGMESTKPPDYWEVMEQAVLDQTKFGMPQLRTSFRAKKGTGDLVPPQTLTKPELRPCTISNEITPVGDLAALNPPQAVAKPEEKPFTISSEITPTGQIFESTLPQVIPKPYQRPRSSFYHVSPIDKLHGAKPLVMPKPALRPSTVSTDIIRNDELYEAKPPQTMPKPDLRPGTAAYDITPNGDSAVTIHAQPIPKPQVKPKSLSARMTRLLNIFGSK